MSRSVRNQLWCSRRLRRPAVNDRQQSKWICRRGQREDRPRARGVRPSLHYLADRKQATRENREWRHVLWDSRSSAPRVRRCCLRQSKPESHSTVHTIGVWSACLAQSLPSSTSAQGAFEILAIRTTGRLVQMDEKPNGSRFGGHTPRGADGVGSDHAIGGSVCAAELVILRVPLLTESKPGA